MKSKYLLIIMALTIVMISFSPIFAEDSGTNYNDSSAASVNDTSISNANDYGMNISENSNQDNNLLEDDSNGSSNTYYVNSTSDNINQMDTPTIQETIDNASAGDTIIINGNFKHVHLVIDKQLTIIGNSSTLSACPSKITGSGSIGVFYLSPQASGTIIRGFNIVNDGSESSYYSVKPYGIYVNGADNVTIEDCNIQTYEGYGVLINNSSNDEIINISSTTTNNNHRTNTGVNVSKNCSNIDIRFSNISNNGFAGIVLESADNITIYGNYIKDNRNNANYYSATIGYGIYVDAPLNGVYIRGNTIIANGNYGVFNTYRVTNVNQTNEIIDNNIIMDHSQRIVYTIRYVESDGGEYTYDADTDTYTYVGAGNGDYDAAPNVVYLYSNFVTGQACGATFNGYDNQSYSGKYNLVFGDIKQIDKGVYTVSMVRKDNGEIASDLNTYEVIFYLNKNNTEVDPQSGDVYMYCEFVNGTATCNFTNEHYKKSNNTITAVGPGIGKIGSAGRLYAIFNVNDSDALNIISDTRIITSNLTEKYGQNKNITAQLVDESGNPVANKTIVVSIGDNEYTVNTDSNGRIYISTADMAVGTYDVVYNFAGDSAYMSCSGSSVLDIRNATSLEGNNLVKNYKDSSRYNVTLLDSEGNPIANQTISFILKSKTYYRTTDSNGVASLPINLAVGKYTITAKFNGSGGYDSASVKNNITVNKASTKLNAVNVSKVYKDSTKYVFELVDGENNPIANQKVDIKVLSKTYHRTTNSTGGASLAINLYPGTYNITVKFNGNSNYNASSIKNTVNVNKITSKLNGTNVYKIYKNSTKYVIELVDGENNPIANQKVDIKVLNKTYHRTTNSTGGASLAINLYPGTYNIQSIFPGSKIYKSSSVSNTVVVVSEIPDQVTSFISNNLTKEYLDSSRFVVQLVDGDNNPLAGQNITLNILGKNYYRITNSTGGASLAINLKPGNYTINVIFPGTSDYQPTSSSYNVVVNPATTVNSSLSNSQVQNILDMAKSGSTINFVDYNVSGVNLVINKPLTLEGGNSQVTGALNKPVFTINSTGVTINNFNIVASNSTGIMLLKDGSIISNNHINNTLYGDNISSYYTADTLFSGNGIDVESSNNLIENNTISLYYNGIYLKNSNNDSIISNDIEENNFGIYYASGVSNTNISNNNISNNIGKIDMDVPEGNYGYGIYANESAVNLTIGNNNIVNNYMGVNFNAANSTGINMYSNLVYNSTVEGVVFWPNYTPVNGEYPTIENNAIFDNAKGPAMFILGEMSANPNGIYAEGINDSSKALHIGYNWFGVNRLTTWVQDDNVGAGTMCPRIRANAIAFENLTYVSPGKYNVYFLRNGTVAEDLPDFTMYAYLNDVETTFIVHKGVGTIVFDTSDYLTNETNNIKISSGSIFDSERLFKVIFEYDIPENETGS